MKLQGRLLKENLIIIYRVENQKEIVDITQFLQTKIPATMVKGARTITLNYTENEIH